MNWQDLQHLLALSHYGSLPAAAEALGVNRTTVSRRILQLERELGVRLVEKVGRDLILTEAGRETVGTAELIEGEVHTLERRVFGRDEALSGRVRLAVTSGIGCLLAPYFSQFQAAYPEIFLEISASDRQEDLELMEADVAIRFTTRPPEGLIGRLIGRPTTAIYASKSLAARLDKLDSVNAIGSHVSASITEADLGKTLDRRISTDSIDVAKALVVEGQGVSQFPCYMVEGDDRLTRIGPSRRDRLPELWLLYHPRLRSQLRVRRFVEFLLETFEALKPAIEAA